MTSLPVLIWGNYNLCLFLWHHFLSLSEVITTCVYFCDVTSCPYVRWLQPASLFVTSLPVFIFGKHKLRLFLWCYFLFSNKATSFPLLDGMLYVTFNKTSIWTIFLIHIILQLKRVYPDFLQMANGSKLTLNMDSFRVVTSCPLISKLQPPSLFVRSLPVLKGRLHVTFFSPFFSPFKNGLNVVLWKCLHMTLKDQRCRS